MADKDLLPMVYDDEDPETAARLDAEAEADIAAGRVVPHEKVVEWLESWGTPNELPCPKP
jgi:predicted transcriptional regulator